MSKDEEQVLYIDGAARQAWKSSSDREGRIELDGLTLGEHFLQIGSPSSPARRGARIVVMTRPYHADVDVRLSAQFFYPTQVVSISFDPARQAFFATVNFRLTRVQFSQALGWGLSQSNIFSSGVTLTPDGSQLLVTTPTGVYTLLHIDPDTLSETSREDIPVNASSLNYQVLHALADGRVLLANTSQLYFSPVREYRHDAQSAFRDLLPDVKCAIDAFSAYQTHMLVRGGECEPGSLYRYEAGTNQGTQLSGFSEAGPAKLAISGDGARMLYNARVYDADGLPLGSLDGAPTKVRAVAISADGRVAAVYGDDAIQAYDLSLERGPFPPLGPGIPAPNGVNDAVHALLLDEHGEVAFAFADRRFRNRPEPLMFVRRLRDRSAPVQ